MRGGDNEPSGGWGDWRSVIEEESRIARGEIKVSLALV